MHKTYWRMHSCSIPQVPKEPLGESRKIVFGGALTARQGQIGYPGASVSLAISPFSVLRRVPRMWGAETTQESQHAPESR